MPPASACFLANRCQAGPPLLPNVSTSVVAAPIATATAGDRARAMAAPRHSPPCHGRSLTLTPVPWLLLSAHRRTISGSAYAVLSLVDVATIAPSSAFLSPTRSTPVLHAHSPCPLSCLLVWDCLVQICSNFI